MSFRCLERKSILQGRSQFGEDQQLVISPAESAAERIQNPERDTAPLKSKTVLQSDRPGTKTDETSFRTMENVPQEVVIPEESVGSSIDTDIKLYCEVKLRSLSEDELRMLVEVSEDSIAKILRAPYVGGGVAHRSMHVDGVGDQDDEGQGYLCSTPVKSVSGVSFVADSVKFPRESPLKRSAGVAFVISEVEELTCE